MTETALRSPELWVQNTAKSSEDGCPWTPATCSRTAPLGRVAPAGTRWEEAGLHSVEALSRERLVRRED